MILKGNQRGAGDDLASHLMNAYDNDLTQVAEIRGTVSQDLHGAFAEFEASALGTRCEKPLYSLSINPATPMTEKQYGQAIELIENRLGLKGQPRAIVFHVKGGRHHCHVVWSRIDTVKMKAVQLSHDRMKLRALSQELAFLFGHQLPEGLARNRGGERFAKGKLSATFGDMAQADRSGISPQQRRAEITAAYRASDSSKAFRDALKERGYQLAKGDQRGFVVVDRAGHVHSLARQVEGARTKDIRAKLNPLRPEDLPSVDAVKKQMTELKEAQALGETDTDQRGLRRTPDELKARQEKRRQALTRERQDLEVKQRNERLQLHAAQKAERDKPFARAVSAVFGLFRKVPVLRSVLARFQKLPKLNATERHRLENEALDRRYAREKQDIDRREKALGRVEARENKSMAADRRRMEAFRQKRGAGQLRANAEDITAAKQQSPQHEAKGKQTWKDRQAALKKKHGTKINRPKGYGFER